MQKRNLDIHNNTLVIANASAVVASVITEIAGNDISSSLNGSKMTKDLTASLAAQRIIKHLKESK